MLVHNVSTTPEAIDETSFKALHPRTSFPRDLTAEVLAPYGAAPLTLQDRPVITASQRVSRAAPALVEGEWVQGWAVRDETAEEKASRCAAIRVSRTQLALACLAAEIIDATEAEEWAAGVALPALVTSAIAGAPITAAEKTAGRVKARAAATIRRSHALIELIRASLSMTGAEADALFEAAAAIED